LHDEPGVRRDAVRGDCVSVRKQSAPAERGAWHHDPSVRRVAQAKGQRRYRPVVESERAPAHVPIRGAPRHPRRSKRPAWNPEPPGPRIAPAAIMMGRPRPGIRTDPRPSITRKRFPVTVVIATPCWLDARIPDVAVRGVVLPASVMIEGPTIHAQVLREVLTGRCGGAFGVPGFGPLVERISWPRTQGRRRIDSVRAEPASDNDDCRSVDL